MVATATKTATRQKRKYRSGAGVSAAQPGLQGTRQTQQQGNMQATAIQLLTGISANCAFIEPWFEGAYTLPAATQAQLVQQLQALHNMSTQVVQQLQKQQIQA